MIDEKPADRFIDDEVGFIIVSIARAASYDYELRHPGHGDQSVHNPHKGGGAATYGADRVPANYKRPVAEPGQEIYRTEMYAEGGGVSDNEYVAIAHSHLYKPDLSPDTPKPSEIVTESELRAVEEYTDGSNSMQGAIIGKPGPHHTPERIAQDQAFANDFNNVLQRNSLDHDTTLHRGMGKGMEGRLKEAGVGGVVKTDRFVSAAVDPRMSEGFGSAQMIIRAPAGTKGAMLSRIMTGNRRSDIIPHVKRKDGVPGTGESEFVMPPGINFRVDKITTTKKRNFQSSTDEIVTLVEVTVVP